MDQETHNHGGNMRQVHAVAFRIFGTVFAACVLLYAGAGWLATGTVASALAIALFAGTIAILGWNLWRWQRVTEAHALKLTAQMREAERLRDAANAARQENERMLTGMSHEILTPLNGLVGMLNLLMSTTLSAEQKNYAETANASGRTLTSIINEVLDTAKGRAQSETGPKQTEIRATIDSVTELLAPRAHAKGIDISSHVAADVPDSLAIDDTHVRQILFNLAGNAIKFTMTGGVAIDVCVSMDTLIITVSDTGIGIADVAVGQVFEDFRQVHDPSKHQLGGTGLGLGITKRLVEKLDGEISVTSTLGQGSIFTATLPVSGIAAKTSTAPKPLVGHQFKLAMGHAISLRHLQHKLEELGGTVDVITSAEELQDNLEKPNGSTLIADTHYADILRLWLKRRAHGSSRAGQMETWIMLTPEERRSYPDLLAPPLAGYMLRPLRQTTLLPLFGKNTEANIDTAVDTLRAKSHDLSRHAPLHVLLVDDNPVNLLLARTLLERNGHRVVTAADGSIALHLFKNQGPFDIILLDVEMPVLNGYETTRQLREMERLTSAAPIPILALTAHMRPDDLAKCLDCGMNDYLTKPFDQHDLADTMARILARKAA